MKITKEKVVGKLKKIIGFIANPKLLLCFGIGWMITNGWSYIFLGVGAFYGIEWMTAVAGVYLAFLWVPGTPEKILTVAIAIGLLRLLFPNDEKTLGVLREIGKNAKSEIRKLKKNKESKQTDQIEEANHDKN